jgi:hypothetical protein
VAAESNGRGFESLLWIHITAVQPPDRVAELFALLALAMGAEPTFRVALGDRGRSICAVEV